MECNSRKLIQLLEKDGWVLHRVVADQQQFKHPVLPEYITLPHRSTDLPRGTALSIYRQAQWEYGGKYGEEHGV